jgi:hypothetical protein
MLFSGKDLSARLCCAVDTTACGACSGLHQPLDVNAQAPWIRECKSALRRRRTTRRRMSWRVCRRRRGDFVTTLALDDVTAVVAQTHSATYLGRDADQASQLAAIMQDIVVCLAGPYAQGRHRPLKKHTGDEWESDIETARGLAARAALVQSGVDVRLIDPNVPFATLIRPHTPTSCSHNGATGHARSLPSTGRQLSWWSRRFCEVPSSTVTTSTS